MQIESGFSLIDTAVSAMRGQGESMRNITSGIANAKTSVPDIVGTESDMGADAGVKSRGSLIDLDNLPIQMTNLNIAAHTYEANVDLLGRYQQMTETTLEILG